MIKKDEAQLPGYYHWSFDDTNPEIKKKGRLLRKKMPVVLGAHRLPGRNPMRQFRGVAAGLGNLQGRWRPREMKRQEGDPFPLSYRSKAPSIPVRSGRVQTWMELARRFFYEGP